MECTYPECVHHTIHFFQAAWQLRPFQGLLDMPHIPCEIFVVGKQDGSSAADDETVYRWYKYEEDYDEGMSGYEVSQAALKPSDSFIALEQPAWEQEMFQREVDRLNIKCAEDGSHITLLTAENSFSDDDGASQNDGLGGPVSEDADTDANAARSASATDSKQDETELNMEATPDPILECRATETGVSFDMTLKMGKTTTPLEDGDGSHLQTKREQLDKAQLCHSKGVQLFSQSLYVDALRELTTALTIREIVLGKLDEATADTELWVALTFIALHDFAQSLEHLRRTYRIRAVLLGPGHASCQVVTDWITDVLHAKQLSDTYIFHYLKALWLGVTYEIVGDSMLHLEHFDEAIEALRIALTLEQSVKEDRDECPDEAEILVMIGDILMEKLDFEKGMKTYSKALSIYEKRLGRAHFQTLLAYHRMSLAAREKGLSEESLEDFANLHEIVQQEKADATAQS